MSATRQVLSGTPGWVFSQATLFVTGGSHGPEAAAGDAVAVSPPRAVSNAAAGASTRWVKRIRASPPAAHQRTPAFPYDGKGRLPEGEHQGSGPGTRFLAYESFLAYGVNATAAVNPTST